MMLLLQTEEVKTLFSFTNILIAVFGFLVVVITAVLVGTSKRRDSLDNTNEKLLKARDTEVADCEKKCGKCKEELEDVTAEYRAITSLNLKELFAYWQIRESEMAKTQTLESENRILRMRLGDKND